MSAPVYKGTISHAHTCPAAQHHTLCAFPAEAGGDRQEMWVRNWGSACVTRPPWADLFSACGGGDLWVPDLDGVKNSSSPALRRWGRPLSPKKRTGHEAESTHPHPLFLVLEEGQPWEPEHSVLSG